jgi:riboflavin-specific deaminase-like protein
MDDGTGRERSVNEPPMYVLLNMAMTADGKIATANRAVTSFGSPRDLAHLYELRATADAILCGARTMEETGATLGNGGDPYTRMRLKRRLQPYPVRVVVSGGGSISSTLPLWTSHSSPIVVLTSRRASPPDLDRLRKLATEVWVSPGDEIDFPAALSRLKTSFGVKRVVAEGGATLNDTLFRAHLIDELHVTICPYLAGGRMAPTLVEGEGWSRLAEAGRFRLHHRIRCRGETYLVYRAQSNR